MGLVYLVLLFIATAASSLAVSAADWDDCEISTLDWTTAPWTVGVRRQSPSGNVAEFPAVVVNDRMVVTPYVRYVVYPGDPWRMCHSSSYTVLLPNSSVTGSGQPQSQEVRVGHVTPHPNITWGGRNDTWPLQENFWLLLHLQEPLPFSRHLRPACLPDIEAREESIRDQVQKAASGLLSGWSRDRKGQVITLNFLLTSEQECRQMWRFLTINPYPDLLRVCGYNLPEGTSVNPGMRCTYWNSGLHIRQGSKSLLVGFVNNYFSNRETRLCDEQALQYVSIFNPQTVQWMRRGAVCGTGFFACSDGSCIPLRSQCDGHADCPDGGDEDERVCNTRNCCDRCEFACGVEGVCLSKADNPATCNGVVDCPNGEDEDHCPPVAESNSLQQIVIYSSVSAAAVVLIAITLIIFRLTKPVLSDDAINAFFNGAGEDKGEPDEGELLDIRRVKYDPNFELELQECIFVKKLGNGHFGIVRLAYLNGEPMAVKTRHMMGSAADDPASFIALLNELKMMQYIQQEGGHENIVRLRGAQTGNIRNYKLQVAMEYCSNGSLDEWLRANRSKFNSCCSRSMDQFTHFFDDEESQHGLTHSSAQFTTVDLAKWAMQVAQGMRFLASKRVLHSDLAARNVLLDGGLNAKICDFGLSHQLYGLSRLYTTTIRMDFAYQWTAPEVLDTQGREYNINSDAWSFGVTVWEIFSFAEIPWGEFTDEVKLLLALQQNHILPQPQDADDELYGIMCACWKLNPADRPSFDALTRQLQTIYDRMCCTIQERRPAPTSEAQVQTRVGDGPGSAIVRREESSPTSLEEPGRYIAFSALDSCFREVQSPPN